MIFAMVYSGYSKFPSFPGFTMKKAYICWGVALSLLLPAVTGAASQLPPKIAAAVKQAGFGPEGLGIYIQDVAAAKPEEAFQADQFLNPASVIKLVTTSAALDLLGSGYRWSTDVTYTGNIEGDTLKGNLYFRGNGDPYLTPERSKTRGALSPWLFGGHPRIPCGQKRSPKKPTR